MSLAPPEEPQEHLADPGAHELSESSDDHFSDANEGTATSTSEVTSKRRAPPSPIPTTRVERVDDEPSYGEVPGTPAFEVRSQDAVPDEVEIIPDGQRSRSTSRLSESDRPVTPGGTPVPSLVVERLDDKPAHGEVPGTAAYELRKADAEPDEVRQASDDASATLEHDRSRSIEHHQALASPSAALAVNTEQPDDASSTEQDQAYRTAQPTDSAAQHEEPEDDGFGDDFDDFEEGAEADQDDDFGDFDDGFREPEAVPIASPVTADAMQDPLAHLPHLTFASLQTSQDILKTISPHLTEIFPEISVPVDQSQPSALAQSNPILTDRSASLWSQLVAPPPLQPPNWIRSRIRRLFLVSLGVPVDLDEILPASKQKKLILPNTNLADGQPRGSISRLRKDGLNNSSSSISSTGEKKKKKDEKQSLERRGPPPPPDFDANNASLLSTTTETAMMGFSDDELKAHVERLEVLIKEASEVLEYWLARKDSAVGDKEAFEGVIENLVGFVRRNRDSKIFK